MIPKLDHNDNIFTYYTYNAVSSTLNTGINVVNFILRKN